MQACLSIFGDFDAVACLLQIIGNQVSNTGLILHYQNFFQQRVPSLRPEGIVGM